MPIPSTLFDRLSIELPPVIARAEVPRLLGGLISAGSLANADSAGEGPAGRFYLGKKAAYGRDELLDWLRERLTAAKKAKPGRREAA